MVAPPAPAWILLALALGAISACGGDGSPAPTSVSCSSYGGAGQNGVCDWDFRSCSDGASYQIQCTTAPGPSTCTCFRNAVRTGSFVTCSVCANVYSRNFSTVNTGCGWDLASLSAAAPPPSQCAADAGVDAGVDVPSTCRRAGASCTGACCPGLECIGFSGFRPGTCG
ncbi:MAG: hypothetical protein JWM10_5296 [Myxococcaceae bacterium]|nr:hypothetical protein [Myxococcaceae bacterium]